MQLCRFTVDDSIWQPFGPANGGDVAVCPENLELRACSFEAIKVRFQWRSSVYQRRMVQHSCASRGQAPFHTLFRRKRCFKVNLASCISAAATRVN